MATVLKSGGVKYLDMDLQSLQSQKLIISSVQNRLNPLEIKLLRQRSKDNNKAIFNILKAV